MTKVNSFDHLKKIRILKIQSIADVTITIQTLHIWTLMNRICDRLNQLQFISLFTATDQPAVLVVIWLV